MLKTFLTERWGLRFPIANAPMTPAAGGALAKAVGAAGGLGMIGVSHDDTVEELEEQVKLIGGAHPFGIGLRKPVLDVRPDHVSFVIRTRPYCVSVSFGAIAPYISQFRSAGIRVIAQVQDLQSAMNAVEAGADLLVAQGAEAGGHTGSVGTLPLLQLILERTSTPVLAAGGIATERGVAAVLAAGAAGAWIGTPFLMTREARIAPEAQAAIKRAAETDTIPTRVFDLAQQIPWPPEFVGRTLRNDFTQEWHGREEEIGPEQTKQVADARAAKNYALAPVYAGQSVGMLSEIGGAADLVQRLGIGAEQWLRKRSARLLV